MRRWNGWGDDSVTYPLHDEPRRYLEELVGPGTPPQDAALEEVLETVPPSRLPSHGLLTDNPSDRMRHARGQSLPDWVALRSGRIAAFPDAVAFPATDAEVQALIRLAASTGACLIPYGGGTSVVGHINPLPGERPVITADLGRLNRLLRFDETSQLATFGAGVMGPDLEAQLRAVGCTLGHYPQSFELSTLGGWITTRSSGQQSLGYGRIERLFAGGRLETPAGSLELPSFPASAAGPDLRELVLGSEGRLGVLTEATVRCAPLPESEHIHAFFFLGFEQGMAAVRTIMQAGVPLSMLRLSTPRETQTTLALAGRERLIGMLERLLAVRGLGDDKCMLLAAFTGREGLVKAARREVMGIAGQHGGVHVGRTFGKEWHKSRFRTPYLRNTLWELGYAIDTLETAVDWPRVLPTLEAIESALQSGLADLGERVHVFSHLSHLYPHGSSIYTTYLFRVAPGADRLEAGAETERRWRVLKTTASRAIVGLGGTISHQHGVGTDHLPYMAEEKGPLGLAMLRQLCACVDPEGLMNPGKLLPEG